MARIVDVTHQQEYDGQLVLNTYTYISDSDEDADVLCQAVLNALGVVDTNGAFPGSYASGGLAEAVQNFQVPSVTHVAWRAITPYDPLGLYEVVLPPGSDGARPGTQAGDDLAPFIAASIRSNRLRRDVRRGFKRYVGIREGDVDTNTINDDYGALTALQSLATTAGTAFVGETSSVASITVNPSIVPLQPNPSPPPAYQLFPTETEAINAAAIGVTYSTPGTVTTQNSRKRGRGA